MKKIFSKINNHRREYGNVETISWLYNCVTFKIRSSRIKSDDYLSLDIDKKQIPYVCKKNGINVVIVASIPYYDIGGGQRCSQLANTFNKMGFNVIYLYGYKSSESQKFDLSIPASTHLLIDDDTVKKIDDFIKKDDLFIFEAPSNKYNDLLDLAVRKKCKIIYENIDNWETSLGNGVFDEETLKKMLKYSDLQVGTAKPLVEQLKSYNKKYKNGNKEIKYLANAVNDEMFCGLKKHEKPCDLITDKKTFLYYGSLWGEWFDWDIIIDLAIKNPRYSINLIGDCKNIQGIMKKCPYNIHFLGLKKQYELPAYLQYVDYAMIPFKTGEIGDYVSPLKIFEYISMYTKVLCTKLPDVEGYPNVYTGDTLEEWEKIINNDYTVDKSAADDFVFNNSWFSRVSSMLDSVYPELSHSNLKNNLSVVILNYNNKNVIFKSINSLLKYNKYYNYEIVVVDNGSKDGSYELLKKNFSDKIKLVQNEKNGCSSGRNLGVKNCNKNNKYIMFLDSDQWITNPYWLMPYEEILKNVENVGLIGWAAGFFNNSMKAYHVVDSFPYRYLPPNCICRNDIGYLGSGGMIVLREDFDKVDGFDVSYDPTCYEDTDFSLKIRDLGKEIYYCSYLGLIHLPHQTTNSGSKEHTDLINKKQMYFTDKWKKKNISLLKMHIK